MGVAGAGKSTVGSPLAIALGVSYLEGDDLHPADNVGRMAQGIPLTDDDRRGWLQAIAQRIAQARRTGTGLVISCSALKRAYRDVLRAADGDLQFVFLTGDPPLLARRLSQRGDHFFPPSLLQAQLTTLEIPAPEERAWTFDVTDPPEAIVGRILERVKAARTATG